MAGIRTFVDISNRLSPSVPGCPTPIIEQYVRDTAIETCVNSCMEIRTTTNTFSYRSS